MPSAGSAAGLVLRCLREDARLFRTRFFVGLGNLLPDFVSVATFVRPVLLRLAGAQVDLPCTVHSPLYVYDAAGLEIGRYAFINQGCRMEGRQTIRIGESALIGPFCCLENVNHRPGGSEELPVIVEAGAWIGARSVLLPGAEVGAGAVIGAGSVVRGTVPAREVWAGAPARFRKPVDSEAREATG